MTSDSKETITLLLVDDDPIIRAGLRAVLLGAEDIEILGEAADGEEAQEMMSKLRPKILLLDLKMPGMSAAELERWVREHHPETVTLVLTAHDRDAHLAGMIDAGAAGYMSKGGPVETLIAAIRRAAAGELLFDIEQMARARNWKTAVSEKLNRLTQRERLVLKLMSEGKDTKEIAQALSVSPKTVAFHISGILERLEVDTRQKAVAWVHANLGDDLERLLG